MSTRPRRKWPFIVVAILLLPVSVYLLGPVPDPPEINTALPTVPTEPDALEAYVKAREAAHPTIKPGCEAQIVWYDSTRRKTPYSLVFLHGFSATHMEGDPIHKAFAERYGCNLYLARLAEHGIDTTEAMLNLTAENFLASAREALAIGAALGEKVIFMSSSTGGTHSLWLTANNPDLVAGQVLYSPNVEIFDPKSDLLAMPWGLQIARKVLKSKYQTYDGTPEFKKYWVTKYRLEALVQLQLMLEATMTEENFARIKTPVFLGYYYKDETHQDQVVSVPAMLEMFEQLGTPESQKWSQAFPEAGEHVICSPFKCPVVDKVQGETFRFAEEVMGLQPVAVADSL